MKKIVIGIVILLVIILLVMVFNAGGLPVRAAQVSEGPISSYVEERAITTLPRIYEITMPEYGRIMPLTLPAGTEVKKGQVVAKMDAANLETAVAESQSRVEAAKGAIALNLYNAIEKTALNESAKWIETMKDTVAAALKKVEASKARDGFAQWYLESTKKMKQAISTKEANKAEMEAAEAKVDYESDMLQHNAIKTIQTIFQLAPVYIKQYMTMKNLNHDILEARLKTALAGLEKAQRDLKRSVMTSPIDGIILKRYFKNERVLEAGVKLLDIGDLSKLEVSANILSQEAVNIKPGDCVDIYGASIGGDSISGTVLNVKPKAFTKKSSLGVEEQRVKVVVAFDKGSLEKLKARDCELGEGYRLYVRIHTKKAQKALIIPRTALFKGNAGNWQVFKIAGGKARMTEVKTGLKNDEKVQVVAGLEKGDLVIVAPPASLVNGSSVTEEKD
jgi:HlyD family secretion protein